MDRSEEDKLMKFNRMMVDVNISMNKSDDDWDPIDEHKRRSEEKWNAKERLTISLTEEMVDLMVDKSKWEVGEEVPESVLRAFHGAQWLLVRLCTLMSDRVGWDGDGRMRHRMVCWLVVDMVKKREMEWNDEYMNCVVDYLVKVLECEDIEIDMWAILAGERLLVKMKMMKKMNTERRDRLHTALTRHSTLTNSDPLQEAMEADCWDANRYQVKWCASWCKNFFMKTEIGKIPCIKLSRDRFEARCDDSYSSPVSSPFPVKSNVYFYEVICVTKGEMWLGWTTKETNLDKTWRMNRNKTCYHGPCIVLQIGDKCHIHHNNHIDQILPISLLHSLTVIGCLLDLDNQRFEFYINGRALDYPTPAHFSTQPYFATARLFPHQQCHFNFGQFLFKFPPRNIRFTTFHEQTGGDVRKYRLMETKRCYYGDYFWFAHPPVDNQVSLFFDDEMQNEVNREVKRVEEDIKNDRIWEWGMRNYDDADDDDEKKLRRVRYIQAIIEVMGNVSEGDNVDVMAQCVGRVIEDVIDTINKAKLLEMFYPYLHLVITQPTITQHRSICMVLLHLIKCCRHYPYNIIKPIHSSVFTYLTRTLTSSPDQWTQLFVLIALADLEMTETEKRQIEGCAKIGQFVETCTKVFEGKDVVQVIKSGLEHRLVYQLYICSNNLLRSITPHPNINTNPTTPATLNPLDLTPQLTLSPCHLSARSDCHWQSVRSVCQVSAHIYYFEVVLLTAGPMTIGWATRRTELARTEVGEDEFSIGFDGYNQCVHHNGRRYHIVDSNLTLTDLNNYFFFIHQLFKSQKIPPLWKAGDVVGCLLDSSAKRFHFFLNGSLMYFTLSPYFSTLPYHACVSLSPHQQVYFNFGQSPFLHPPPKHIDYLDFYSTLKPTNPSIQFHNVQMSNSQLLCNSTNIIHGNSQFVQNRQLHMNSSRNVDNSQLLLDSNNTTHGDMSLANQITPSPNMQCCICSESTSTKLVRSVCCDTLTLCYNCSSTMKECPKCKKRSKV